MTSTEKPPVVVLVEASSWQHSFANAIDASVLAARGRLMVVTVNFRLGVLGKFFSSSSSSSAYCNSYCSSSTVAVPGVLCVLTCRPSRTGPILTSNDDRVGATSHLLVTEGPPYVVCLALGWRLWNRRARRRRLSAPSRGTNRWPSSDSRTHYLTFENKCKECTIDYETMDSAISGSWGFPARCFV